MTLAQLDLLSRTHRSRGKPQAEQGTIADLAMLASMPLSGG